MKFCTKKTFAKKVLNKSNSVSMLSINVNSKGLVFSVNVDGHDIHFREWKDTNDCIYYFPLITLVDNGHAHLYRNECIVPYENIYLLDEDDMLLLGLPDKYNKSMRLRSEGMLNSTEFNYKVEFLTHIPDGELLPYERVENILNLGTDRYLLNENQYRLIKAVDEFNAKDEAEKTPDYNFRCFAQIKSLALNSKCELDSYLQNENVYAPENIKIAIDRDEDGFMIFPSVDIEEDEKFQRTFEKMKRVQGVYPVQKENGERVRVVMNPEQKLGLETLKKSGGRCKTREEIKDIVENPTEYFNPEQFDLSELYSDRVIEIGVYKPKFYPFICPYQSCWIAGATIETPKNGTTRIFIANNDELSELQNAIDEAIENNKSTINFKDTDIDIDDAKFLAETASRQLKQSDKPVDVHDENNERKVLIIEENAEELGFTTKKKNIERGEKYTLFKNPYLQKGFSLKTHQEEGVAWLQHLHKSKASGCLMADDMGLGKTLQILYFIDWHSRTYPNHKPYLIIAPISLLENWENEYNRFFMEPRMAINRLTSKDIPRQFNKSIVDWMQGMDIILTNYESLRISQLNFCAV